VAAEPPMDVHVSKLIQPSRLANGSGFTSQLCTLYFHNSDCLHVSIRGTSIFFTFFKT